MIVSREYRELSVKVEISKLSQYSFNAHRKEKLLFILINTLLLHIPLLALTDGQRNEYTCCSWAGGTFFPVVLLCQFLVLVGNKCWFYILMDLEYNTVVMLCQFFGSCGKQFLTLRMYLVYNTVVRLRQFFGCGGPLIILIGFLFFGKQLASQNMFLVQSKISTTTYLFLVFYRSSPLQSQSFLENIEIFICKKKLVNNRSIPSKQLPQNQDIFPKISRLFLTLQLRLFLKKYRELSTQVKL